MSKLRALFLVCLCNLLTDAVNAQPLNHHISVGEAQKLVSAAIYPNRSNAELDKMDNPYEPDFIFFEAIDPNPNHAAHMGTFAVNRWTGDVWSTAGSCSHVTSLKLVKMQKRIRERSKISPKEFGKLQAKKPICDVD